ncbi:DUF6470 family protein [Cytobacillus sp. Hz8]|uniref:DUF6470 family protein n=1 Tax=Cytobacillus sp. Hz8 TaxID=3347168 RepID=UPI0035E10260
MKLAQIRLQSTPMKIGLHIQQPKQSIEQPHAIQSIQQPQAKLEIETIPGRLNIDQTKAWEDMDLKPISKRVEEAAQYGYEDFLKGVARRAEEGAELMAIENKGNPIADQAKRNSEKTREFTIGWIPSYFSVKINYEPAKVNIKVEPQKPIIDAKIQRPIHNYEQGKVDVSVEQWNSLKIDFTNLFDDSI